MYSLKGGLHSPKIHFLGVVDIIVLLILDDFSVQQNKDLTHGYKKMGRFIALQKWGVLHGFLISCFMLEPRGK